MTDTSAEIGKPSNEYTEIDDGLGVLIEHKIIFHGSGTAGIETFNPAEETTVGAGIYLTSKSEDAAGYARRRARRDKGNPIIYECSIDSIKLLNFQKKQNKEKVFKAYRSVVEKKLEQVRQDKSAKWYVPQALERILAAIDSGNVDNTQDVTAKFGAMFSQFVQGLGYEGIMAYEGGEGNDVGDHDTFVIFDPSRVKIIKEEVKDSDAPIQ